MNGVKTELTLSFIVDLSQADAIDCLQQMLAFARERGVRIAGNTEALGPARKALGAGRTIPIRNTSDPAPDAAALIVPPVLVSTNDRGQYVGSRFAVHVCPHCRRDLGGSVAFSHHLRICPYKPSILCPLGCGGRYTDSPNGAGQHRRHHHSKKIAVNGSLSEQLDRAIIAAEAR